MSSQSSDLHVAALFRYPVKSLHREDLDSAYLTPRGFAGDRQFMAVTDQQGKPLKFLTQRKKARMAGIHVHVEDQHVTLSAPGMPDFGFDGTTGGEERHAVIWDQTCSVSDQGDGVAQWLSDYIGEPVRLVQLHRGATRIVGELGLTDETTLADRYPVLVTYEADLSALNAALEQDGAEQVPMTRFRPNIVIGGGDGTPWLLDTVTQLRVGDAFLRLVKHCARCATTAVDQERGVRASLEQPLGTLRRIHPSPDGKEALFGANAIPLGPFPRRVQRGQNVEITARGELFPFVSGVAPL